jgi:hypothetical protein
MRPNLRLRSRPLHRRRDAIARRAVGRDAVRGVQERLIAPRSTQCAPAVSVATSIGSPIDRRARSSTPRVRRERA